VGARIWKNHTQVILGSQWEEFIVLTVQEAKIKKNIGRTNMESITVYIRL
jgi:hypothetical protein